MALPKQTFLLVLTLFLLSSGCLRYSFTGTSIPEGVNTIYIPFFPDNSRSGLSDLSDRLNQALIERFVNQSKLQLANDESTADAVLDGTLTSYANRPFSIGGNEQANQNQVSISVRASFRYTKDAQPLWEKPVSGDFTYDPTEDPIEGERDAAAEVLEQIANKLFNDAVSNW